MKKNILLTLALIGLMLFSGGCTPTSTTVEDSETPIDSIIEKAPPENALPEIDTVFEGKITSVDTEHKMLTIDMTVPYKDTIILNYDDQTEFSQTSDDILRNGVMIRFETNGTMTMSIPAQMSALKITDSWVAYDDDEKIQGMFDGRKSNIFSEDKIEMQIQKGEEFLVQLHRSDALNTNWYWEVSNESAFEYQAQAQYIEMDSVASLYQMKALTKGEHFLYFHEYDPVTGNNIRDISFQLFVMDASNTEGNIVELVGEVVSIENETIILKSDDKEKWIYAPNMNEYGNIQPGDQLVVGAELGEASYILAFAAPKSSDKTEAGLPIIQHVVMLERIDDEQVDVLWNEALLSIYHNNIVDESNAIGSFAYIEYAVDKANEGNELLHFELIK